MPRFFVNKNREMKNFTIHKTWLLILGIILMAATHLTFNIEIIAWVSSVPFMVYLGRTRGFRSRLYFSVALLLSWSLCVLKIITDPIPVFMVPLYSLPLTLIQIPGYLVWARFRTYRYSLLLFPAVMVVMEWIQYSFTPFGSWGAIGYTQAEQLILKQSVSLFGMAGLGFLIYMVNSLIAEMILQRNYLPRKLIHVSFILLCILVYGSIRLDRYQAVSWTQYNVAAVGTDSEVSGLPVPTLDVREKNRTQLFDRTKKAAGSGSKLVVWNEASTIVLPEEENQWEKRLSSLAMSNKITLIASYVVLLSESPFRFENKYVMFTPDGRMAYTYHKHEPVPGEPAVRGTEPIRSVLVEGVRLGGAICYDYDFPYLASEFGKEEADIVALPSSDWRGIDPIHTEMATFRAIEQGHSIVRSARFGLSAAINPVGEMVAKMSSFDENDRILIAQLPIQSTATLYSIIGDIFIYFCLGYLVLFLLVVKNLFQIRQLESRPRFTSMWEVR